MNILELIEDLELEAHMICDKSGADDARLQMQAAGVLRKIHVILTPFANAADKADKASEEQKRLLGSELTPDATFGFGVKISHLKAARDFLRINADSDRLVREDGSDDDFISAHGRLMDQMVDEGKRADALKKKVSEILVGALSGQVASYRTPDGMFVRWKNVESDIFEAIEMIVENAEVCNRGRETKP